MDTTRTLHLGISELIPYINWIYFFHAWGVNEENAAELKQEANQLLAKWAYEKYEILFRVRIVHAHSSGDNILLYTSPSGGTTLASPVVLPLLRQQHPPFLCMADFVPPANMEAATIGIFASSVPFTVKGLLEQTLADRLAEAAAEMGHEITRKIIWGYSPFENLTPKEMFAEHYQGKRPAVGYPSMPDQSINFIIDSLLDFPSLGISLTENGAMIPHASTSGLMISHPRCIHFKVGSIGEDQLQDYAVRRGIPSDKLRKFIDTI